MMSRSLCRTGIPSSTRAIAIIWSRIAHCFMAQKKHLTELFLMCVSDIQQVTLFVSRLDVYIYIYIYMDMYGYVCMDNDICVDIHCFCFGYVLLFLRIDAACWRTICIPRLAALPLEEVPSPTTVVCSVPLGCVIIAVFVEGNTDQCACIMVMCGR